MHYCFQIPSYILFQMNCKSFLLHGTLTTPNTCYTKLEVNFYLLETLKTNGMCSRWFGKHQCVSSVWDPYLLYIAKCMFMLKKICAPIYLLNTPLYFFFYFPCIWLYILSKHMFIYSTNNLYFFSKSSILACTYSIFLLDKRETGPAS